jgi:LmbE family N-acetylglucosaminyl deacetylase
MKRALVVSPHLGDAVAACGATLAGLAGGGWTITLATVFTASGPLAAERDPAVMAARRDEDRSAAHALGLADVVHLPLAPAGAVADDRAAAHAAAALGPVLDAAQPDRVFAPLPVTHAPDERAVIEALRWLDHPAPVVRFRPVVPAAARTPLPDERGIPVARTLERKLAACAAYASAPVPDGDTLRAFAAQEGRRLGTDGPAEALVEPAKDTKKRRPGQDDEDDKAALVRALRGGIGLTR